MYLKVAQEFGEVTWQRGLLRKGYSLCHGVAGNGYTFLVLFQLTGVSEGFQAGVDQSNEYVLKRNALCSSFFHFRISNIYTELPSLQSGVSIITRSKILYLIDQALCLKVSRILNHIIWKNVFNGS